MSDTQYNIRIAIIEAALDIDPATQAEIAQQYGVSLRTVERYLHQYRHGGKTAPKPRGGGRPRKLTAEQTKNLRIFCDWHHITSIRDLRDRSGINPNVSDATIRRAIQNQ